LIKTGTTINISNKKLETKTETKTNDTNNIILTVDDTKIIIYSVNIVTIFSCDIKKPNKDAAEYEVQYKENLPNLCNCVLKIEFKKVGFFHFFSENFYIRQNELLNFPVKWNNSKEIPEKQHCLKNLILLKYFFEKCKNSCVKELDEEDKIINLDISKCDRVPDFFEKCFK